jgi:hypothetical protein
LITGFSTSELQTTGNTLLNDIKNNSNKLSYDASGNLLVNVAIGGGGGSVDGTVNIKDSNGANILATTGSLNSNITNASLAVTGTFFQETQPVSLDVLPDVTITNTSFDAKIRDKDDNAISSSAYGIDGVRGLDVSIKNATQADPLFVEIPTTNVVNTMVNNFPSEYPINAGGALSSAVGALYVNLRDANGNPYGIADAPLVVQSNVISGFSLDTTTQSTNSKLDTLNTTFSNKTLSKTTSSIDVSGQTLNVNTISGFALETGGNLASIKANSDKLIFDASGNLLVNVAVGGGGESTGIVNIKDSSGSNILSDGSGNLNTKSKLIDASGNIITCSTDGASRSLDVHISNYRVSTSDPDSHSYLSDILSISGDIRSNTFLTADSNSAISLNTSNIDTKLQTILTNSNKNNYDASGNLLVNVVDAISPLSGSYGNIANNITLLGVQDTPILNLTGGNYKKDCILTVEDSTIASSGYYILVASSNGTNYETLGIIQPLSLNTSYRGNSTILNLTPYTHFLVINGSVDTYNNVSISLYSS